MWAGPVFAAEPSAVPALSDAGLDEAELGILGESVGLPGNCGISDTILLSHTHTEFPTKCTAYYALITKCNMMTSKRER